MHKILLKLSIPLLIIEFGLVLVPLSILLLVGIWSITHLIMHYNNIEMVILLFISILSLISVISLFYLSRKVLFSCNKNLIKQNNLWLSLFVGLTVVLISLVSVIIPPSKPYSDMALFRENLEMFFLGAPLVIMSIHLRYEALKC